MNENIAFFFAFNCKRSFLSLAIEHNKYTIIFTPLCYAKKGIAFNVN